MKIGKIFEVRWAFSTFNSLRALLNDFAALHAHFTLLSVNGSRAAKESSKCKGLANKMSSWIFVAQLCMLKDALRSLKNLSLFFQNNDANLINALKKVEQAKAAFRAMKQLPGKSLQKMISCYNLTKSFKGVKLRQTDADVRNFESTKNQFFQALIDNLVERFPCTDILAAAQVLDPHMWPDDCLELTLFGDREVASLCKLLSFTSVQTVNILSSFSFF
jgi:hypothetical protein